MLSSSRLSASHVPQSECGGPTQVVTGSRNSVNRSARRRYAKTRQAPLLSLLDGQPCRLGRYDRLAGELGLLRQVVARKACFLFEPAARMPLVALAVLFAGRRRSALAAIREAAAMT